MSARIAVRALYSLVCYFWARGPEGWDHTLTTRGSLVSVRQHAMVGEGDGDRSVATSRFESGPAHHRGPRRES